MALPSLSAPGQTDLTTAPQPSSSAYNPSINNPTVVHQPTALERISKTLSVPLNIETGIAESALGLGKPGVLNNIADNIKQGGTWGSVLRQKGAGPITSAVGGFALDVLGDPIGGISESSVHLAPNLIEGLVKGGPRGLAQAVAAHATQGADDLFRGFHPGYADMARGQSVVAHPVMEAVAGAANKARETFLTTVGRPGGVLEAAKFGKFNSSVLDKVGSAVDKFIGPERVDGFNTLFKYADKEAMGQNIAQETSIKAEISAKNAGGSEPLSPAAQQYEAAQKLSALKYAAGREQLGNVALKSVPEELLSDIPKEQLTPEAIAADPAAATAPGSKEAKDILSGYLPGSIPDASVRAVAIPLEAARTEVRAAANEIIFQQAQDTEAEMLSNYKESISAEPKTLATAELSKFQEAAKSAELDRKLTQFGASDASPKAKAWILDKTNGIGGNRDAQLKYLDEYFNREVAGANLASHPDPLKPLSLDPRKITMWIDKTTSELLMNKTNLQILRGYDGAVSMWKKLDIGLNVSLYTTSFLGNFAATHMMGVNPFTATYMNTFSKVVKVMRSGDTKAIHAMMSLAFGDFLERIPDTIRKTMGVNPYLLSKGGAFVDETVNSLATMVRRRMDPEEGAKVLALLEEARTKYNTSQAAAALEMFNRSQKTTALATAAIEGEAGTTFRAQELTNTVANEWVAWLREQAAKGNVAAGALHWAVTSPVDAFSSIDQWHRIATTMHLTQNGISETELLRVLKWMGNTIDPATQIVKAKNANLYFLDVPAAMDISNRMYLNFQAMPAFVKIMKNLPILGHPFFSYQYGVTTNVARAFALNPGWINKANYLIQEVSGQKSAAEEAALNTLYYEHLQDPGWMKMPWFLNNPMYANLAQYTPLYQVNLLRTQSRGYKNIYDDKVVQAIDSSPFFKTVEGKFLLDYIVIPTLTHEALTPTGQQIYPAGASELSKIGIATAQFFGKLVPPNLSEIAAVVPLNPSQAASPYLPSSYVGLKNALQSKTAGGIVSKQGAANLTAKQASKDIGLPVTEIPLPKPKVLKAPKTK